ncbi:MAG: hypothetical protein UT55_C0003G0013 [Candidatus Peregrinibacteria bacterium GW2011_GWE2_39_6]|nr:MAG: hypothetical protein UT36_C0005G0098 [Candidatus Peregrinibacteria bacterium GW2011_GWF2_39_17]KKR26702.1 MAG: hypothetical protein UT55_C0003G0013 [Candidatus Peregrinibacteria bacterium GW2011_GWE2_39_6]HCW32933.1 hypothetical protein [Candidatus Peregrinibacteria bacterium]
MFNKKRQNYLNSVKEKLDDWRMLIEDLQSGSDRSDPVTDDNYEYSLDDLWTRLEELEEMVRNLENSEEDWVDLKEALEEELEELETTIEEYREKAGD